mmetsp:Transcript_46622/g.86815  ORF Transcript_46622/g.86815 Transcript_46622/m.86815 type:complete len:297 (+) Transcript_46622:2129-3019(+)
MPARRGGEEPRGALAGAERQAAHAVRAFLEGRRLARLRGAGGGVHARAARNGARAQRFPGGEHGQPVAQDASRFHAHLQARVQQVSGGERALSGQRDGAASEARLEARAEPLPAHPLLVPHHEARRGPRVLRPPVVGRAPRHRAQLPQAPLAPLPQALPEPGVVGAGEGAHPRLPRQLRVPGNSGRAVQADCQRGVPAAGHRARAHHSLRPRLAPLRRQKAWQGAMVALPAEFRRLHARGAGQRGDEEVRGHGAVRAAGESEQAQAEPDDVRRDSGVLQHRDAHRPLHPLQGRQPV